MLDNNSAVKFLDL